MVNPRAVGPPPRSAVVAAVATAAATAALTTTTTSNTDITSNACRLAPQQNHTLATNTPLPSTTPADINSNTISSSTTQLYHQHQQQFAAAPPRAPDDTTSTSTNTTQHTRRASRRLEYVIEQEIGRGSFATVYRARSSIDSRLYAIKTVSREKLNRKLAENLETEILILKRFHHPNIVALLQYIKTDLHINLVMEYCALGDLSNYIKQRGLVGGPTLSPGQWNPLATGWGGLSQVVVRHFLAQLSCAMEFLHANRLIHRDLKPQNVLLAPPAKDAPLVKIPTPISLQSVLRVAYVNVPALPLVRLADFGFARSLSSQAMASTLCGSPLYMAPEILKGATYDEKVDLWSLGAIMYEMISSVPPFRASTHVELLNKINTGDGTIRFPGDKPESFGEEFLLGSATTMAISVPKSSKWKGAQIPEDLKDLTRKLLRRNPKKRISYSRFLGHDAVIFSRELHMETIKEHYTAMNASASEARSLQRSKSHKNESSSAHQHSFSSTPGSSMKFASSSLKSNTSAKQSSQVSNNSIDIQKKNESYNQQQQFSRTRLNSRQTKQQQQKQQQQQPQQQPQQQQNQQQQQQQQQPQQQVGQEDQQHMQHHVEKRQQQQHSDGKKQKTSGLTFEKIDISQANSSKPIAMMTLQTLGGIGIGEHDQSQQQELQQPQQIGSTDIVDTTVTSSTSPIIGSQPSIGVAGAITISQINNVNALDNSMNGGVPMKNNSALASNISKMRQGDLTPIRTGSESKVYHTNNGLRSMKQHSFSETPIAAKSKGNNYSSNPINVYGQSQPVEGGAAADITVPLHPMGSQPISIDRRRNLFRQETESLDSLVPSIPGEDSRSKIRTRIESFARANDTLIHANDRISSVAIGVSGNNMDKSEMIDGDGVKGRSAGGSAGRGDSSMDESLHFDDLQNDNTHTPNGIGLNTAADLKMASNSNRSTIVKNKDIDRLVARKNMNSLDQPSSSPNLIFGSGLTGTANSGDSGDGGGVSNMAMRHGRTSTVSSGGSSDDSSSRNHVAKYDIPNDSRMNSNDLKVNSRRRPTSSGGIRFHSRTLSDASDGGGVSYRNSSNIRIANTSLGGSGMAAGDGSADNLMESSVVSSRIFTLSPVTDGPVNMPSLIDGAGVSGSPRNVIDSRKGNSTRSNIKANEARGDVTGTTRDGSDRNKDGLADKNVTIRVSEHMVRPSAGGVPSGTGNDDGGATSRISRLLRTLRNTSDEFDRFVSAAESNIDNVVDVGDRLIVGQDVSTVNHMDYVADFQ